MTPYGVHLRGLSPLKAQIGYQPPLFPDLEEDVSFKDAGRFGERFTHLSGAPLQVRKNWQIGDVFGLPIIVSVSEFGSRDLPRSSESGVSEARSEVYRSF